MVAGCRPPALAAPPGFPAPPILLGDERRPGDPPEGSATPSNTPRGTWLDSRALSSTAMGAKSSVRGVRHGGVALALGAASILAPGAPGMPLDAAQGVQLSAPFAPGVVGDVSASEISPDSRHVVYRADQDADEVFQLYGVPIEGGLARVLSPTPVLGGDVQDFRVSPDSRRVVYRADQDHDEVFELYSAALSGRQPPVKLNGPLAAGGDVASFALSAGRVVYLANQDSAARAELYSVPLRGGTPVRLNGALVSGGNVVSYLTSPDGKRVVYAADERTDQVFELFVVTASGGTRQVLGRPLDSSRSFQVSPDSRRVVFLSDGLYGVSILGGEPSLLSAFPQYASSYHITPDSRRVLCLGPGEFGRAQLYSAPIEGGPAKKLTEHFASRVNEVVISPDSRRAAYSIEGGDSVHSVFTVPVEGGEITPIREHGSEINIDAFSPDSTRLLYNELVEQLAYSAPAAGGASIQLAEGYMVAGSVTPDSIRVVCTDARYVSSGNVYSTPVAGGALLRLNDTPAPDGSVVGVSLSPDGARVVYRADQDTDEVFELYSVSVHGGPVTKLNPPLVAGATAGDVGKYLVSPDGTRLVYLADQDADQVYELFGVHLPGGVPLELSGPLVRNGDVDTFNFAISADSRRVVYVADQEVDGRPDLYSAPIDGGPAVKLSTQAVVAYDFDISPDSSWVVFRDDEIAPHVPAIHAVPIDGGSPIELAETLPASTVQDVELSPDSSRVVIRQYEHDALSEGLYSVPVAGGAPTRLNPTPVIGGRILHSRIGPDGSAVFFAGDIEVDERYELFRVPIDGGPAARLNGPLVAGGDVLAHAFQLDAGHCVYLADQDTDGVVELYAVTLPGLVRTKLNPPLVAGGNVRSAVIASAASRVVYLADQNVNEVFELYSVPIGGGPATRLNAPLVAGGDVGTEWSVWISPDSQRVVYYADQEVNNVVELYSVPIGGGPAVKLNGALVPGGDALPGYEGLQFDAAAGRVLFLTSQNDVVELFSAALSGGAVRKLNAPLAPNGDVGAFRLARGLVVYRADQDQDEVFELFGSFLPRSGRLR